MYAGPIIVGQLEEEGAGEVTLFETALRVESLCHLRGLEDNVFAVRRDRVEDQRAGAPWGLFVTMDQSVAIESRLEKT